MIRANATRYSTDKPDRAIAVRHSIGLEETHNETFVYELAPAVWAEGPSIGSRDRHFTALPRDPSRINVELTRDLRGHLKALRTRI